MRQAWMVVLTAALFFLYVFIQYNLFNVIGMDLMKTFNIDASALGQLGSMFFYAETLCLIPAGVLLDRYSTKKIMLYVMSLTVLGTLIFGIAESYALAAIGRFLAGCGSAFCFLSCIRIATRWFPPHKMAFVTGVVVTMAMLGGMIAQTPLAVLVKTVGWRHAVYMDVGLGVLITFAIAWIVQNYPSNSELHHTHKAKLKILGLWKGLKLVLTNPYNWMGGVYTLLLNLPVVLLGAMWGITYLVQAHHLSPVQSSYATSCFFLGVILGCPAFGWLSDVWGRRIIPMVIGAVLSLIIILLLIYIPDLSLGSLIGLFFLIGFVTSSQTLSYPLIAELNPSILTSSAIGVASTLILFSAAVFQPLFGKVMEWGWNQKIIDNVPVYSLENFTHALWIMPIGFILGLIVALFMKETYCTQKG